MMMPRPNQCDVNVTVRCKRVGKCRSARGTYLLGRIGYRFAFQYVDHGGIHSFDRQVAHASVVVERAGSFHARLAVKFQ
jgi:hypothetical protein